MTGRTRGHSAVSIVEGEHGRSLSGSLATSPIHGIVHSAWLEAEWRPIISDFLSEISEFLFEEEFTTVIDKALSQSEADLHYDAMSRGIVQVLVSKDS